MERPCGRGAIGHSEHPIEASTNRFCPILRGAHICGLLGYVVVHSPYGTSVVDRPTR